MRHIKAFGWMSSAHSTCRQDLSITLSTICVSLTYNQHMLQIKGLWGKASGPQQTWTKKSENLFQNFMQWFPPWLPHPLSLSFLVLSFCHITRILPYSLIPCTSTHSAVPAKWRAGGGKCSVLVKMQSSAVPVCTSDLKKGIPQKRYVELHLSWRKT